MGRGLKRGPGDAWGRADRGRSEVASQIADGLVDTPEIPITARERSWNLRPKTNQEYPYQIVDLSSLSYLLY